MERELEPMMDIKKVKHILGISFDQIYVLISEGKLKCSRLTGAPVSREDISERVSGLRFDPVDVREFIRSVEVK